MLFFANMFKTNVVQCNDIYTCTDSISNFILSLDCFYVSRAAVLILITLDGKIVLNGAFQIALYLVSFIKLCIMLITTLLSTSADEN